MLIGSISNWAAQSLFDWGALFGLRGHVHITLRFALDAVWAWVGAGAGLGAADRVAGTQLKRFGFCGKAALVTGGIKVCRGQCIPCSYFVQVSAQTHSQASPAGHKGIGRARGGALGPGGKSE